MATILGKEGVILKSSGDPTIAPGLAAPIGSVAEYGGVIYIKVGVGNISWTLITGVAPVYYSDFVGFTGTLTSTSTTDVLLTGMTFTPPAGKYLINFNATGEGAGSNRIGYFTVYVNGVAVPNTEQRYSSSNNLFQAISICGVIGNVTAGQTIQIRWRSGSIAGSNAAVLVGSRYMSIVKLA